MVVYKEVECEVIWGEKTLAHIGGEIVDRVILEYDFIWAAKYGDRWVRFWYEPIEDEK
jgi:hypothetical protein